MHAAAAAKDPRRRIPPDLTHDLSPFKRVKTIDTEEPDGGELLDDPQQGPGSHQASDWTDLEMGGISQTSVFDFLTDSPPPYDLDENNRLFGSPIQKEPSTDEPTITTAAAAADSVEPSVEIKEEAQGITGGQEPATSDEQIPAQTPPLVHAFHVPPPVITPTRVFTGQPVGTGGAVFDVPCFFSCMLRFTDPALLARLGNFNVQPVFTSGPLVTGDAQPQPEPLADLPSVGLGEYYRVYSHNLRDNSGNTKTHFYYDKSCNQVFLPFHPGTLYVPESNDDPYEHVDRLECSSAQFLWSSPSTGSYSSAYSLSVSDQEGENP